ncbi:MAG: hypothetical protein DSO07_01060 [Thermoproteota archaeon]|nr:MAG: hypothetical protein DSO07_01060 [Candidatus Korarchaeota archaeon]
MKDEADDVLNILFLCGIACVIGGFALFCISGYAFMTEGRITELIFMLEGIEFFIIGVLVLVIHSVVKWIEKVVSNGGN